MAGRPSKLTEERQQVIVAAIEMGLTYEVACQAAGINQTTYYNWKRRGLEAKSGRYFQFVKACQDAEAIAEKVLIERLQERAVNDVVITKEHVVRERNREGDMVVTKEETHTETRPAPWQIDAWLAERRNPERWGRRVVDQNIKVTEPPHIMQIQFVEPEPIEDGEGLADEDDEGRE